jgi:hypothetical protein
MMRRLFLVTVAVVTIASAQTSTQSSSTRQHVQTLASDKFDGRLTGSAGERLAGDYIVSQLQRIGAKPVRPGGPPLYIAGFAPPAVKRAARISLTTRRPAARAGWWPRRAPWLSPTTATQRSGGVRRLRTGGPTVRISATTAMPALTSDDRRHLAPFSGRCRAKDQAMLALLRSPLQGEFARQHGAKAMIVVTGPTSPNAGELVPMTIDTALAGSGIVGISVTGDTAKALFARTQGKTLEDAQKALDSGNPHVAGFELPGVTAQVKAVVEREKQTGHNILAYLPATIPTAGVQKPWVALGAHYDHLGHGTGGGSLAAKDEAGRIHAGADDYISKPFDPREFVESLFT